MRSAIRRPDYVCLPCLLREAPKRFFSASPVRPNQIPDRHAIPVSSKGASKARHFKSISTSNRYQESRKESTVRPKGFTGITYVNHGEKRLFSSGQTDDIELSPTQLNELQAIHRLRNLLQSGLSQSREKGQHVTGLSIEDALKLLPDEANARGTGSKGDFNIIPKLEEMYTGRELSEVLGDLGKLSQHRRPTARIVKDPHVKMLLRDFGLLSMGRDEELKDLSNHSPVVSEQLPSPEPTTPVDTTQQTSDAGVGVVRDHVLRGAQDEGSHKESPLEGKNAIPRLEKGQVKSIESQALSMRALDLGHTTVPTLSHGLRRVLFNQGVHQLQDIRTGVYNFDPYLQRIMPVSEFNFDALGEYITSSEDQYLRSLAREYSKRYIGSSSSMGGTLTHFHHLLSQFRDLNTKTLSQSFEDASNSMTLINKAPSAVFLRFKDGVYGVDADKEYDSANILMSLGRSVEKLLTVSREEFETYRKSASLGEPTPPKPESYHYCEQGDFLLRSQLDAYDPDLPGTGMFDLKTRAVVSIRMNISRYEQAIGYQIKSRFGNFGSYEREYYDMIRSALLKYTLQVRMGRMDGIFVAYHNIERIFGFQYLPLAEMDLHIHGQEDRILGDQEFKLSVALLNKVFDTVTAKYPGRSLRFHFQARPGTTANPGSYMHIFAEPLEEEQIRLIQDSRKAEIAEIQQRLLNPAAESVTDKSTSSSSSENDAGVDFHNERSKQRIDPSQDAPVTEDGAPQAESEVMGLKLMIRNKQNATEVSRPLNLTREDVWTVEYTLEEMSHDEALKRYRQCQARRKTALAASAAADAPLTMYTRRLLEMSRQGAEWRKRQDAIDEKRQVRMV